MKFKYFKLFATLLLGTKISYSSQFDQDCNAVTTQMAQTHIQENISLIEHLPDETFTQILTHLDYPSLCQASLVNHRWHALANDSSVLRARAIQDNIIDEKNPELEKNEYKRMLNFEHFFEFAFLPKKTITVNGISPNGHYIVGEIDDIHRPKAYLWDKGCLFIHKSENKNSSSHFVDNKRNVVIQLRDSPTSREKYYGYWDVKKGVNSDAIDLIKDTQEYKDMDYYCNRQILYNYEERSSDSKMIIEKERDTVFINFYTKQGELILKQELTDYVCQHSYFLKEKLSDYKISMLMRMSTTDRFIVGSVEGIYRNYKDFIMRLPRPPIQ